MKTRDLLDILIHAVLAIFGVSARELRYKDERKVKVARLISNAFVSSFGATIVFFISSMSNLPPQMGYIMAGLVGWGGPQVIDRLFEKSVGIMMDTDQPNTGGSNKVDETPGGEEADGDV
jgi:hypothetical protein